MQPLVLQLQAECFDSSVPLLEVLRKALVVARKLSLTETQGWIEKELKGYQRGDEVPPHRILQGQVQVFNPYHGWQPVFFQDYREAAYLSRCPLVQPIGELEDLLKHGSGNLQLRFDPQTEAKLMQGMEVQLQPVRQMSRSSVKGILDSVRHMVLEWSLELEKGGILGEGLVFSAKEKETAAQSSYTINYNGPVSNSQVQQGSPGASQNLTVSSDQSSSVGAFLQALKEHADQLSLQPNSASELGARVAEIEEELKSRSPNANRLRESLRTVRSLLEGCAGSLIASGLLHELGKLHP